MSLRSRLLFLGLLVIGCGSEPSGGADSVTADVGRTEHAGFVVRLGVDTIRVERFSWSHGVVEGDIVDRSPTTSILHYRFTVAAGGRITRLETTQRPAGVSTAAAPLRRANVLRTGSGFDVTVQDGDSTRKRFVPAPAEAIPLFDRSLALYEVLTIRLRRAGSDTITVPILDLDSLSVAESAVWRLGPDSVVIPLIFPRGERARVDSAGRILGVSGLVTSYKWLTERVADLDVAALAHSFADRDAKRTAFGAYSSRDTVRAVIDGAHITIDYGRPSKRGRVIFGGLVPWGEVWRTGADLATHITTDRALRLSGLVVPPGTYTLYTLPSPRVWKLIVNRQTGQSGRDYDPAADLGRIEMRTAPLTPVIEQLTITIAPRPAGGGAVQIAWDNLRAEAPFSVVPNSR